MKPKRPGFSGTQAGAIVGGGVFLAFISLYVLPTYVQRSNHYESMYRDAIRVIGGFERHKLRERSQPVALGPAATRMAFQADSKMKPDAVSRAERSSSPEPMVAAAPHEIETWSPVRLASSSAPQPSLERNVAPFAWNWSWERSGRSSQPDLPPFTQIAANGDTHFTFVSSGTPGVRSRSSAVRAEVVGGVLLLSGPSDAKIEVCGPGVENISLSGNASVMLDGAFARQIHLDLSGHAGARTRGKVLGLGANLSGSASLDIGGPTTESVSVLLAGSSTFTSRGTVRQISLRASGTSQISLKSLTCQSASINLAGKCELKASGSVGTISIAAEDNATLTCDKLTARNAGIGAVDSARISFGHVDVLSADAKGDAAIQCQGKPSSLSQHKEDNGSITLGC